METNKHKVYIDEENSLHYDSYVHHGKIMYLREALSPDSPDQLYNYLKNHNALKDKNLTPEDYGIYHPDYEEYKDMSREQLLSELIYLKQQIRSLERAGFI